jgi:ferredoxin/flavodoxin
LSTDVFYFSGTGNSLFAANIIADNLAAKLISIPHVLSHNIESQAESVVAVFPEYHGFSGGIPAVVGRFFPLLQNIGEKQIYVIATYAVSAGSLINNISQMIEKLGGELSGGFIVRMPHSSASAPGMASKSINEQRILLENCRKKMNQIADYIRYDKKGTMESAGFPPIVVKIFKLLLGNYESKQHIKGDNHFIISTECNGCAVCEKLCPVNNIKMVDSKPLWQGKCEECFACLQWCPEKAIQLGNAQITNRYRNPDITLKQMLNWDADWT